MNTTTLVEFCFRANASTTQVPLYVAQNATAELGFIGQCDNTGATVEAVFMFIGICAPFVLFLCWQFRDVIACALSCMCGRQTRQMEEERRRRQQEQQQERQLEDVFRQGFERRFTSSCSIATV
jgi:hypothetical protein